ncbi:MAG: heme ABC transporter ATP-binding protein [Opitutales bacterium]
MIAAEKIAFRRGRRQILHGIDLSVRPGKVTAILGPNGSGKSTLLRLLTHELHPHAGEITVDGRPLPSWPKGELARRFATLPQHSTMTFDFAVEEIVWMGRTPHRRVSNPEKDATIVTAALERLDLLPFRHRLYTTLSGGERQRVHLARTLAQIWDPQPEGPRYLFLDEPTSSLDLKHQHATLGLARELAGEGTGVLVVLHDIFLARRYADAVLLLKEGRGAGFGPAEAHLTAESLEPVFEVDASLIPGISDPQFSTVFN